MAASTNNPSQAMDKSAEYPVYPFLGLLLTVGGTGLALFLLPPDPQAAGALRFSGTLMSLALVGAPVLACLRNLRAFFRVEHLLMFGLAYWLLLDMIQGLYPLTGVRKEGIAGGMLATGLFAGGIWCAGMFRPWPLPRMVLESVQMQVSANKIMAVLLVAFMLGISRYAIPCNLNPLEMWHYLGSNRWAAPWSRGQLGGWDAFLDHLVYFGYLVPALTTLLARQQGWSHPRTLFACLLSLIIITFLAQGGSRRIIGVVVGSAMLCWLLLREKEMGRGIWLLVVSALGVLMLMEIILEIRTQGIARWTSENRSVMEFNHIRVDDNFLRLAQIIDVIPDKHPFIYLQQIFYILVRPIPRVFWPGKPIDAGFDLARFLGKNYLSLSISIVGEWYLCMGLVTVFLGGFFHGSLAFMWDRLLFLKGSLLRMFIFGIGTMVLFAGLRSMQDMVIFAYMLVAWVILAKLMFKGNHVRA